MSRRRAALLSWTMWVLGLAGMAIGAVLAARNGPISPTETQDTLGDIVWLSSFVGFGLVGALVVSSRPSNRIGWILSGLTFSVGLVVFASAYGRYALVTAPGTLPMGVPAAWLTTWVVLVPATLAMFLVLFYPTGSITTTLGRFVTPVFLFLTGLDLVAFALREGPVVGDTYPPDNPFAVPGTRPFLTSIIGVLGAVLAVLFVVGVFDLFVRFRRSRGVERQQFRWFFAAFAAFPILFILANLLEGQIIGENGFDPTVVIYPLWGIGAAAAIAVAITRHGLYEINRIVSRTVSYSVVVGVLAAVYVGGVTWLTSLLPPAQSDLAVAASTLAVAALFNPLRRRVQAWVDRRFNRSRYDAQRVMDDFAGSLRDRVDPDGVVEGWVGVVSETMQPTTVAVWVKG